MLETNLPTYSVPQYKHLCMSGDLDLKKVLHPLVAAQVLTMTIVAEWYHTCQVKWSTDYSHCLLR
jgi:hypothetical protein